MAVKHFGGSLHGLTLTDSGAPSGAPGEVVPVGYPQELVVVSVDGCLVEASWDGVTWVELGVVPSNGVLRLGRVRYRYMRGSVSWTAHQVDSGGITGGIAGPADEAPAPTLVPPDASATKAGLVDWLADQGVTGVSSLTKSELWDLINDLIDN